MRVNSRSSAIGRTALFALASGAASGTVTASTGAAARQAWALYRIASKLANDTSATIPRRNPSHLAPLMAGNSASQLLPMPLQQLLLAEAQAHLGGVPGRQAGSLDLHADELGALALALLLQPVGEDEARGVVVDVRDDGVEEAFGSGRRSWQTLQDGGQTAGRPRRRRPPGLSARPALATT